MCISVFARDASFEGGGSANNTMERTPLRCVRRNVPCTMPLPCLQGRSAPIGRAVFATARNKMNKRQNGEPVDCAPWTRRRVALILPWRHARGRSMSAFSLCASPRSTRQPHSQRQNTLPHVFQLHSPAPCRTHTAAALISVATELRLLCWQAREAARARCRCRRVCGLRSLGAVSARLNFRAKVRLLIPAH